MAGITTSNELETVVLTVAEFEALRIFVEGYGRVRYEEKGSWARKNYPIWNAAVDVISYVRSACDDADVSLPENEGY